MVNKCCVPFCRGNYRDGPSVHVFRFPRDPQQKQRWLAAIPRANWTPSKYSRVCQVHFEASDILWDASHYDPAKGSLITAKLQVPRLKEGAVPKFFPGCTTSMSSKRQSPRKSSREKCKRQRGLAESLETKAQDTLNYCFSDLQTFKVCNRAHTVSSFWDIIERESSVIFLHLKIGNAPESLWSVVVDQYFEVSVHFKGVALKKLGDIYTFPFKIVNKDIREVHGILSCIENLDHLSSTNLKDLYDITRDVLSQLLHSVPDEQKCFVEFICSQIDLLQMPKQMLKYPYNLLIFSALLHLISPRAYKFIRNCENILLPHPRSLRNLCSLYAPSHQGDQQESDENILQYVKHKVIGLEPHELYVTLMVDEISLGSFVDYETGSIVEMGEENPSLGTRALVFMIQSILSPFRDVVHIFPIQFLTSETLHAMIKQILLGLETIGFKVIGVVSDNSAISHQAMSSFVNPPKLCFVYPHPLENTRPLFYMVDTIHLLNCVRNNWINQKNPGHWFAFPDFDTLEQINTASFIDLQTLCNLQSENLLKHGHGLTVKALWPTNLEGESVLLASQIFSEFVVENLKELGPKHNLSHYSGTAKLIKTFCSWWHIVNVKTPLEGQNLTNVMQKPLTNNAENPQNIFLNNFLCWLENWGKVNFDTGVLLKETHSGLMITTQCLLELADYCITELGFKYILPGKFQTDVLESRFGKHKQLSGSHYNVSLKQLCEIESKLQKSSTLELSLGKGKIYIGNIDETGELVNFESFNEASSNNINCPVEIVITGNDISEADADLPVLTYIAGCSAYVVLKKLECEECKPHLVYAKEMDVGDASKLIKDLDRGALLHPQRDIVNVVLYNYLIVKKLLEHEREFLRLISNHRLVIVGQTLDSLLRDEIVDEWAECSNSHDYLETVKMLVWVSTNILLKNYANTKSESSKIRFRNSKCINKEMEPQE